MQKKHQQQRRERIADEFAVANVITSTMQHWRNTMPLIKTHNQHMLLAIAFNNTRERHNIIAAWRKEARDEKRIRRIEHVAATVNHTVLVRKAFVKWMCAFGGKLDEIRRWRAAQRHGERRCVRVRIFH